MKDDSNENKKDKNEPNSRNKGIGRHKGIPAIIGNSDQNRIKSKFENEGLHIIFS